MKYLKAKAVKQLLKQEGRQSTPEFMRALDLRIEQMILGITKKSLGRKRLTAIEVEL